MNAKENQKAEVPEASTPGGAPAAAGNKTKADNAESSKPPTTPRGTPEQIEQWKAKAEKADEHWDRLLRATAGLENFKKRAARERQEAVRFANSALLEKLIPALDNLDMALSAADSAEASSVESLRTGITMICNQLKSVLTE